MDSMESESKASSFVVVENNDVDDDNDDDDDVDVDVDVDDECCVVLVTVVEFSLVLIFFMHAYVNKYFCPKHMNTIKLSTMIDSGLIHADFHTRFFNPDFIELIYQDTNYC
uniref:Uncharacterized protein n=1 Tax=Glossina austeni TaxID=7395 RepID=A0A1A9V5F5_GLOAU